MPDKPKEDQRLSQGGQPVTDSPSSSCKAIQSAAASCQLTDAPSTAGAHHWGWRGAVARSRISVNKGPCSFLLIQLLLPLLIVFLLPTIKLDYHNKHHHHHHHHQNAPADLQSPLLLMQAPSALLTLVRLPLDRLRFAIGLASGADAFQIGERQDLQEEETMQLMSPGERRYAASPHYVPSVTQYHRQPAAVRPPPQRATTTQEMAAVYPAHGSVQDSDGPSGDVAGVTSADPSTGPGDQSMAAPGTVVEGGEGAHTSSSLQTRGDLPAVRALNVKCEKNHMTVNIVFDRPFYGLVFSKGHYNDQKCVHLPANSGQTSVSFDIHLGKCGMSSSDANGNTNALAQQQQQQHLAASSGQQQQPTGLYIENTIIIQYDPQVQEIYDQARKLRCTWYDYYEKSVTFRPYNVDMLDAVTANFLGDNIQCWMQIQVGKGPWSSEVAGIVKIGQTMTMVLAIKDDENRFDMLVRNCVAHDGKHPPIQLVDEYGCVARPKIMGKFQKVRNFGPAATVVSYAHFQAFKFPDSMSVHFQCVIQVCRYECPEPACNGAPVSAAGALPPSAGGTHLGSDQSAGADYTASGTEIVASKEAMPTGSYLTTNGSLFGGQATAVGAIKLDQDAQLLAAGVASSNRVQTVKLDTSMMTGRRSPSASTSAVNGGPLPPHLLHTAGSQESRTTYLAGGPSFARGQPVRPVAVAPPGGAPAINGRPPMLTVRAAAMAPSDRGPGQFSSPYQTQPMTSGGQAPHHRQLQQRSSLAQRMGELMPASVDSVEQPASQLLSDQQPASHPLSLIASPRGMQVGVALATAAPNHRERRSVQHISEAATAANSSSTRNARSRPETSTDIRTQKSIQVVSPDDVAFSLMGPADEVQLGVDTLNELTYMQQRPRQPPTRGQQVASNVCFSATKLMLAILVTVITLAFSIVIVAYVVIRQRARLASDKLAHAAIYQVAPAAMSACSERQRQVTAAGELLLARQREEMQQRNNCLARLYSQFVPANYWRGQEQQQQ